MRKQSFVIGVLALLGGFSMSTQVLSASPDMQAESAEWYIDKNMSDMTPANRYMDAVVVYNPAKSPLYVRTSIKKMTLDETGARATDTESGGPLRVFPEEFVVPPGGAFQARLLADVNRLTGDAGSYYVRFSDVSALYASGEASSSAVMSGFQLAYDVMVAVHRSPKSALKEGDLVMIRGKSVGLRIENRSGQHIYLNRGYFCDRSGQALGDCKPWDDFPRQSLLPGEAVAMEGKFNDHSGKVVGLVVYPTLNSRTTPNRLYVPMP